MSEPRVKKGTVRKKTRSTAKEEMGAGSQKEQGGRQEEEKLRGTRDGSMQLSKTLR